MSAHSPLPRAIPLTGASNLRDLGGYRTGDGRRVKFGRIYRSAALHRITEEDKAILNGLGLRSIVDFRTEREREVAPTPDFGPANHNFPIETQVGASLKEILDTREATGADLHELLGRAYDVYPLECAAQYRGFIELVLDEANHALLFHCAAGKDRTGFGAALLLTALGVPFATVVEDYLATNTFWRGDSALMSRLTGEARDVLMRAHRDMLERSFSTVERHDGSFDAYMARAVGLDAITRARLQDMLLEAAD